MHERLGREIDEGLALARRLAQARRPLERQVGRLLERNRSLRDRLRAGASPPACG